MMRHWRAKLPVDAIIDVRYEDLVEDQEEVTHVLLNYLGLPFESSTISFYTTNGTRSISTASVGQVRQPIYKSAVGRWENYKHHLGPLLDALGDLDQYNDWGTSELAFLQRNEEHRSSFAKDDQILKDEL
eukprot:1189394-Prorocentrum_minimum.AAC.1